MPSYDHHKIRAVGETYLPKISAALRETKDAVDRTSPNWSAPFNPKDAEFFAEVCKAYLTILEMSALNVDDAAQVLIRIADNYQQNEQAASGKLIDIFSRVGDG